MSTRRWSMSCWRRRICFCGCGLRSRGTRIFCGRIREARRKQLTGGEVLADASYPRLVRAGLIYAYDAIDECHRIVQEIASDDGLLLARDAAQAGGGLRECAVLVSPDGKAGGIFAEMHAQAAAVSPLMGRQNDWDPYVLVGECEQVRFGGDLEPEGTGGAAADRVWGDVRRALARRFACLKIRQLRQGGGLCGSWRGRAASCRARCGATGIAPEGWGRGMMSKVRP